MGSVWEHWRKEIQAQKKKYLSGPTKQPPMCVWVGFEAYDTKTCLQNYHALTM